MNAKDKGETNDQAIVLEDLSAPNAEASKVKGGIELETCLISGYNVSGHGAN